MSLGPIISSRGLSLPEPWFRYMATHLRLQAAEDLHMPTAAAAPLHLSPRR